MLLVQPVPFRIVDGQYLMEAQAANGLDRWADNFARIVVAAPVVPEEMVADLDGFVWVPLDGIQNRARVVAHGLPWAFTPVAFLRAFGRTRRLLGQWIDEAEHLEFAIGGLTGDWASLAAVEAIRRKRHYAIHTDRVEHEVIRKTTGGLSLARRLKALILAPLMELYHHYIIRRCSLGLWHGDDCYRAYAPWLEKGTGSESHLIHDVHTQASDGISSEDLERKLNEIRQIETLELCYMGRIDPMKAPLEWLAALAHARDLGAKFRATWYGEGRLQAETLEECRRLKLDDIVRYPGFIAGRPQVLEHLRQAHALVFTHVTPESPRNLIEALVSGTPIVGYDNAYAMNLLAGHGGGATVPMHDTDALGREIYRLWVDRENLVELTQLAAKNGERFNDAAVFAERSDLIKRLA